MTKKKKSTGFRMRAEVLIILVFFLSFIVWAISKCNAKQQEYVVEDTTATENGENGDTSTTAEKLAAAVLGESTTLDRPQSEAAKANQQATDEDGNNVVTQIKTVYATKLYVTIDSLKMRTGPGLNNEVITKLALFDEVIFLNEVSDSTQYLSLGNDVMANEPWVKVRHWKGQEGWVYGAGVHYYKFKYPGLE